MKQLNKFRVWDKSIKSMSTAFVLTAIFKEVNLFAKHSMANDISKLVFMFSTGYKDIHGKEVYAGDLLAYPEGHEDHGNDPVPVVFEYGCFTVDGSAIWDYAKWIKKGSNRATDPTYQLEDLEVVGNIYENKQ